MAPYEQNSDEWRQDALDVLDDTLHWRHLDPAGWTAVDTAVATLSHSVDRRDVTAACSAVTELELLSPCRCSRGRNPDGVATPAETVEAVTALTRKIEELPNDLTPSLDSA